MPASAPLINQAEPDAIPRRRQSRPRNGRVAYLDRFSSTGGMRCAKFPSFFGGVASGRGGLCDKVTGQNASLRLIICQSLRRTAVSINCHPTQSRSDTPSCKSLTLADVVPNGCLCIISFKYYYRMLHIRLIGSLGD